MNTVPRLFLVAALCGLVLAVGFFAFNAGVARSFEQKAPIVQIAPPAPGAAAQPYPYPYPYPYFGWHHHGGFGFLLFPLFIFAFWLVVVRALFGRGRHPGRGCGPGGPGGRLDEWHRRAHERLGDPLPSGPAER